MKIGLTRKEQNMLRIQARIKQRTMRKKLFIMSLFLGILSGYAQEKVMNIQKTDGKCVQTRVADLSQITFLTVKEGNQGLQIKTASGEIATVLFEGNPVLTTSDGKLTIKSSGEDALTFEIADIKEIVFCDTQSSISSNKAEGISCVVQNDGVLFLGIPEGVVPCVCTLDGRGLPSPSVRNGEMKLNKATLGTGVFIVKISGFSCKIRF